ncbi:hypothetical protein IPC97_00415 [Pseudomonas aeruginosa]|nr:hypothetical protein IPC97_00415 [Pseudomonas aeruginosa]
MTDCAARKLHLAAEGDQVGETHFNHQPLRICVAYGAAAIMVALSEQPSMQAVTALVVLLPVRGFDYRSDLVWPLKPAVTGEISAAGPEDESGALLLGLCFGGHVFLQWRHRWRRGEGGYLLMPMKGSGEPLAM